MLNLDTQGKFLLSAIYGTPKLSRVFSFCYTKNVFIGQISADCGMYIPLSDDKHRFVQKVHSTCANGHWELDVIVTQLLRYHMPLLYCVQPFNFYVCCN